MIDIKESDNIAENTSSKEGGLDSAIQNATSPEAVINIIKTEADRISKVIEELCIPSSSARFTDLPEENGIRKAMREKIAPQMIKTVQTFGELYNVLEKIGEISGSNNKPYFYEDLIRIIDKVRDGSYDISYVTKTYGLRDAVIRLLDKKPIPNDPQPVTPTGAEMPYSTNLKQSSAKDQLITPDNPDNPTSPQSTYSQKISPTSEESDQLPTSSNPDDPTSPQSPQSTHFQNKSHDTNQKHTPEPPTPPGPEKKAKLNPEHFRPNNFPRVGPTYILRTIKGDFDHATIIHYTDDEHILVKPLNSTKTLKIPLKDLIDPKTKTIFAINVPNSSPKPSSQGNQIMGRT